MAHLVLAGGGHAHLTTLANIANILAQGHRLTVIGPSPHHYYSGMGPGMLGGTYDPAAIRFATQQVVERLGGRFLQDRVVRIEPQPGGRAQRPTAPSLRSGRRLSLDLQSRRG